MPAEARREERAPLARNPSARGSAKRSLALLFAAAAAVAVLDQAAKYWAVARLTTAFERRGLAKATERIAAFYGSKNLCNDPFVPGRIDERRRPVEVVPGYWNHQYVENPGAAFGMLAGVDERVRVPLLHAVSLSAIAFIALFHRRLRPDQRLLSFALALVLGGALGNFVDRLARGYVIDFIDWHWRGDPRLHWPTFNVADAAISLGVFLMLIDGLFGPRLSSEDVPALEEAGTSESTRVLKVPGEKAAGSGPAAPGT
jgi:signal peptidase II